MKKPRYHIFLSYRRDDGKELARLIKESLAAKGYRVFLDMDELQDGVFDERILSAIEEAPIYMILMTEHCFDRCCNTNDWVRQEMEHAIRKKKIIVPLNPDKQFWGYPDTMPSPLKEAFSAHQYSAIDTGPLYQESINKLVKERVKPVFKNALVYKLLKIISVLLFVGYIAFLIYRTFVCTLPEYFIEAGDRCMEPDEEYVIDYRGAIRNYRNALTFGYTEAYAKIGSAYEGLSTETDRVNTNDWVAYEDTSVTYYQLGAYAGDSYAQVLLAQKLAAQGTSILTNHDTAFYWAQQAYDAGNPQAPATLGYLYRKGFGVKMDTKKAEEYFREGIARDDNYARTSLGVMLRNGEGLPKDYVAGTQLLIDAMSKDDFGAVCELKKIDIWVNAPKVDSVTNTNVTIQAFEWDRDGNLSIYCQWHNKEYPGGYMQIDRSAYIEDLLSGECYRVHDVIDCKFSPDTTMVPLGNKKQFALVFEGVPQTICKINLFESDTSDWKFYGVHVEDKIQIVTAEEYLFGDWLEEL